MALKKSKTLDTSISAEYWRVIQLNNNFDRSDSVITLALYVNQAARENGAQPVDSFQRALGADFSDRLFSGSGKVKDIKLSEAYAELKKQAQDEMQKPEQERNAALAWFADAEDV